jgi:hypothetical protein
VLPIEPGLVVPVSVVHQLVVKLMFPSLPAFQIFTADAVWLNTVTTTNVAKTKEFDFSFMV